MKKILKTISMLKCLKLTIMEHCAMGNCHRHSSNVLLCMEHCAMGHCHLHPHSTCVLLRLVQLHLAEHAPWLLRDSADFCKRFKSRRYQERAPSVTLMSKTFLAR